ncbi:hypothetical protein A2U01_0007882, partial [Trifolium medium]|nr:hypothetical protein [Trifolium medium]
EAKKGKKGMCSGHKEKDHRHHHKGKTTKMASTNSASSSSNSSHKEENGDELLTTKLPKDTFPVKPVLGTLLWLVGMAAFADGDKADTVVWDMGMKNVKVHIGMAKPKDGCTLQFGCGKPLCCYKTLGELVPIGCLNHRKVIEQSIFKVIFLKLATQENTTVTDEGSIAG